MTIRAVFAAFVLGTVWLAPGEGLADDETVVVYKSPTCGCCAKWADHMHDHGFNVEIHDVDDLAAIKAQHNVPGDLQSCHTAIVGDYVIEGHVPASDILALLESKAQGMGLAVPGMPIGSPGMEYQDIKDSYAVISFDKDGTRDIVATY